MVAAYLRPLTYKPITRSPTRNTGGASEPSASKIVLLIAEVATAGVLCDLFSQHPPCAISSISEGMSAVSGTIRGIQAKGRNPRDGGPIPNGAVEPRFTRALNTDHSVITPWSAMRRSLSNLSAGQSPANSNDGIAGLVTLIFESQTPSMHPASPPLISLSPT
mmetsp:Transcript_64471/g.172648  ORF Transcript_64471/g.172648 Transcript_64471/m.172648 type:complete len:163 (+) Transcript_64471:756-1244(+)